MLVANGSLTTDSKPQLPGTFAEEIPPPSVNRNPLSGRHFGCIACSCAGLTSCSPA